MRLQIIQSTTLRSGRGGKSGECSFYRRAILRRSDQNNRPIVLIAHLPPVRDQNLQDRRRRFQKDHMDIPILQNFLPAGLGVYYSKVLI